MDKLNSAYIIPPYILTTLLGEKLHLSLLKGDEILGKTNTVHFDSPNFERGVYERKDQKRQFSPDNLINEIIRSKLIYKMSILGILGVSPNETEISDDYLFDLLAIFKDRVIEQDLKTSDETNESEYDGAGDQVEEENKLLNLGEISFKSLKGETLSQKYANIASLPLRELLISMSDENNKTNRSPMSFVRFNNGEVFDYPLPSSWSPLVPYEAVEFIEKDMNMKLTLNHGFPSINFQIDTKSLAVPPIRKSKHKYLNFITNYPVPPSVGLFYYEVKITQTSDSKNDFQPIISNGELSIETNSSMRFSMGYTTQHVKYDVTNVPKSSLQERNFASADLNTIKDHISNQSETIFSTPLSDDLREVITSQPGEFKGSYALCFESQTFYNSAQRSDSTSRSGLTGMTRRISSLNRQSAEDSESGKVPLKIELNHGIVRGYGNTKVSKTDTVGCGINFINKTMFYTINGILVETIKDQDLQSKSHIGSPMGLFISEGSHQNVIPIMGFKLNDNLFDEKIKSTPTLEIRTNLGFEEFEFDIVNYFSDFKIKNEESLLFSILEQTKNANNLSDGGSKVESSILKVDENPKLLHNLIKDYLNHEGYVNTFNAFAEDLESINIIQKYDNDASTGKGVSVLQDSHAKNRGQIRKLILNFQFEEAIIFLDNNYPDIFKNKHGFDLRFRIKFFWYLNLIKTYLDIKLNLSNFNFELESSLTSPEEESFRIAYEFGIKLHEDYSAYPEKLKVIEEISAALLIDDIEVLKKLPKVNHYLCNYYGLLNCMIDSIMKSILKKLGYEECSNLEKLFAVIDKKFCALGLEHNDDNFSLINVERDYAFN